MPPKRAAAKAAAPCTHGKFDHAGETKMAELLKKNKEWAASVRKSQPRFFDGLATQQSPEFLYIGCSDSRVPANQIMGLAPGEIFVQRNVGNQALHSDMNLMSCLEYAVKGLKIKTIIVCGHYNCGAVKAALSPPQKIPYPIVNCWITDIREAKHQAKHVLSKLDDDAAFRRLCELNVQRQVFHVCTSPVVQAAWADGQELHVWGMIYDVADGLLKTLEGPLNEESDVNELRVDNNTGGAAGAIPADPSPPKKKAKAEPAPEKAKRAAGGSRKRAAA